MEQTSSNPPARGIEALPAGGCLERLLDLFGGPRVGPMKIAKVIGLGSYRNVYNWTRKGYIPAKWAAHVELISEGQITALQVVEEAAKAIEQLVEARSA